MNIVSRAEWGARPPKYRNQIATPSRELWLHHTASPSGGAARVRAIQDFHMDKRGWSDIAYSFLVNHEGTVFEGRGPGMAGGHTKGHNTVSHAICVLGHYDNSQPSDAAIEAVIELARTGHSQGWWPATFTGGHRDVGDTSCPGDNLYRLIPEINRQLEEEDMALPDSDIERIVAAIQTIDMPDQDDGVGRRGWTHGVKQAWGNSNKILALLQNGAGSGGEGVSAAEVRAIVQEELAKLTLKSAA